MFSNQQRKELELELTAITERYCKNCAPCYRAALLDFLLHSCVLFDRYTNLFARLQDLDPVDGETADCSSATREGRANLEELERSPPIGLQASAEPDPRPTARAETNRHRQPPPPPVK